TALAGDGAGDVVGGQRRVPGRGDAAARSAGGTARDAHRPPLGQGWSRTTGVELFSPWTAADRGRAGKPASAAARTVAPRSLAEKSLHPCRTTTCVSTASESGIGKTLHLKGGGDGVTNCVLSPPHPQLELFLFVRP